MQSEIKTNLMNQSELPMPSFIKKFTAFTVLTSWNFPLLISCSMVV